MVFCYLEKCPIMIDFEAYHYWAFLFGKGELLEIILLNLAEDVSELILPVLLNIFSVTAVLTAEGRYSM